MTYTAKEELRSLCDILARENSVKIVFDDSKEATKRAHYNTKDKTITLGTAALHYANIMEHVGLLLHEIGHVHNTPADLAAGAAKAGHGLAYNVLEDMRSDEKLRQTYDGADLYLSEAYDLRGLAETMRATNPAQADRFDCVQSMYAHDISGIPDRYDEEMRTYLAAKKKALARTLAIALLAAEGHSTVGMYSGITEADELARNKLATMLRAAKYAKAEDIPQAAEKMTERLREVGLLPPPGEEKKESTEASKESKESKERGERARLLEMIDKLKQPGAHTPGETSLSVRGTENIYAYQDERARPQVDRLKRVILAKLRENEHTRYEHGKRKGMLNKKALSRVARDNFRVYQKRILPKGKKYAVSIVLDTSGSMWHETDKACMDRHAEANGHMKPKKDWKSKINVSAYCTALLARTFRGLGYPVGVTLYGKDAENVLEARDQYIVPRIQGTIDSLTGATWCSGDNRTHKGIQKALPGLIASGIGREKLLIIITDGGLQPGDVEGSALLIEKARKAHGVHTMIFYVEDGGSMILGGDERREKHIQEVDDLAPACIELIRGMAQ